MSLSKVEQDICQFVVHQLLNQGEPTRRQALLKQFRGSLSDALRKLIDRAVLKTVDQTYNNETCLPRAIAFYYCNQPEALEFARKSTENVLKILLALYERELDKDPPTEQKQFSPADVESEAYNLELGVDERMVRLGLYFVEELSILSPLRKDEKQVFPVSFGLGEHIFEYEPRKIGSPWDLLIERGRTNVENYPYGRSLERFDISEQPRNISDLPNKERLMTDVSSFAMRKAGIALIVIDLDHFKEVNDTKGHPEGDACLDRVVKVIGGVLGRKGILYRWGGDEFAVVLPDFSTEEAHATAERIRVAVEQEKPGADLLVTTSIGVCGSERMTNRSAEELLAAADKAMYASKNQGKNRVTSWSTIEIGETDDKTKAPVGRTPSPSTRKVELRIHAFEKSCFTLVTNSSDRGQLLGMHVNLDMALENRGSKGAVVHQYDLHIKETDKTYQDIKPNLSLIDIQGRRCIRNISNEPKITTDGIIRVHPETMTQRGFLPFFPLDAPREINGPVHCQLTVTDTDGNSVAQDFELREV